MLRMAHRIATTKPASVKPFTGDHSAHALRFLYEAEAESREQAASATTVVVDNIAQYYAGHPQQIWRSDDFPSCVPFMDDMLIEWVEPPRILIDGRWVDGNRNLLIGCLVHSEDISDDEAHCIIPELSEPVSRLVTFNFWMSIDGVLNYVGAQINAALTPDGNMAKDRCVKAIGRGDDRWNRFVNVNMLGMLSHVPMLALSFANCKNVTRRDETASLAPPDKWIRRQKAPHIKYHVLDINPMKEVLRTEGGIETNGLKKALHICRGHFAHYENGLFGRGEACTVWRPAHVRGQAESGIVLKDYRVNTGN